MRAALEEIWRSWLGKTLYALLIVWALAAISIKPARLILIENAFVIAAGFGVSVAYAQYAFKALRAKQPTQGDMLALGIWLAWTAFAAERVYSLVGRALGKDIGFFNTSLHTGFLFLTLLAGICHLVAPEAVEGRIPRRTWVWMGWLAAGAMLILIGLASLVGL